jgi:hypothetical protein
MSGNSNTTPPKVDILGASSHEVERNFRSAFVVDSDCISDVQIKEGTILG